MSNSKLMNYCKGRHDVKPEDRELLKKLKNTTKNKRGGHRL